MSILEILYPPAATKDDLRRLLITQGFAKGDPFIMDWPNSVLWFTWFEAKDYLSTDGVTATVFKTSGEEQSNFKSGAWGLYTQTRVWASSYDRQKQNDVIRTARRVFGGRFINDCSGVNRYTEVEPETKTPVGRRIWAVYSQIAASLAAVTDAMPQEIVAPTASPALVIEMLQQIDTARVLYNALVPFALSALERFFRDAFVVLLTYDEHAQTRIAAEARKIDLVDVLAIRSGQKTLEDVIASWSASKASRRYTRLTRIGSISTLGLCYARENEPGSAFSGLKIASDV